MNKKIARTFHLRWFVVVALVVLMTIPFASPVLADTTADVSVTATPEYIAITDNVTDLDFGIVTAGTTDNTSTDYVGITNLSTVQTDMTIAVTADTWAGSVTWAHSDTATADTDQAGLNSNRGGSWGTGDVIVKYASPNYIYEDCPATTNFDYGLSLVVPTAFTDGVQKSITVRVTAAAG